MFLILDSENRKYCKIWDNFVCIEILIFLKNEIFEF